MATSSQLYLLSDHIKLSLLERQRAIALQLPPNSHDREIARSLDDLRDGIDSLDNAAAATLRRQYEELYLQFSGKAAQPPASLSQPNEPGLIDDFSAAQTRPRVPSGSSFMNATTPATPPNSSASPTTLLKKTRQTQQPSFLSATTPTTYQITAH